MLGVVLSRTLTSIEKLIDYLSPERRSLRMQASRCAGAVPTALASHRDNPLQRPPTNTNRLPDLAGWGIRHPQAVSSSSGQFPFAAGTEFRIDTRGLG